MARVFTVHPNNTQAFHLRLLLHHVRGPTSFDMLRRVTHRDDAGYIIGEKQCSTFQEACYELGLLENDSHWNQAMQEAALSSHPDQIR